MRDGKGLNFSVEVTNSLPTFRTVYFTPKTIPPILPRMIPPPPHLAYAKIYPRHIRFGLILPLLHLFYPF
jgi:hypothetical protein